MSQEPLFPVEAVATAVVRSLEGERVPAEQGELVAAVLVDAEVRGHPSHGLRLLPVWLDRLRQGGIDAASRPRVIEEQGPVTRMDARGGLGPVAAAEAADRCAEAAARAGVGVVAVSGANHVGMLAAYRQPFLERDVVGLILNVSGPSVVPPGRAVPALGNDAICLIAPCADRAPLIVDFATGQVACGKIRVAAQRREPIPHGWLVDRDGAPSIDPAALDAGGAVPLFGGHKGLCTALLPEVLAGMLGGGTVSPLVRRQRAHPDQPMDCAQTFIGFSRRAFGSPDLGALSERLERAVAPDDDPDRLHFPERAEQLAAARAAVDGIPVPASIASLLGLESP